MPGPTATIISPEDCAIGVIFRCLTVPLPVEVMKRPLKNEVETRSATTFTPGHARECFARFGVIFHRFRVWFRYFDSRRGCRHGRSAICAALRRCCAWSAPMAGTHCPRSTVATPHEAMLAMISRHAMATAPGLRASLGAQAHSIRPPP